MPRRSELVARRRLATNARRIRQERGWTQELAAERVGCSVQHLRRVERATVSATIDFVARLAASYRVDVRELFGPAGPWENPRRGRPPRHAKPG